MNPILATIFGDRGPEPPKLRERVEPNGRYHWDMWIEENPKHQDWLAKHFIRRLIIVSIFLILFVLWWRMLST